MAILSSRFCAKFVFLAGKSAFYFFQNRLQFFVIKFSHKKEKKQCVFDIIHSWLNNQLCKFCGLPSVCKLTKGFVSDHILYTFPLAMAKSTSFLILSTSSSSSLSLGYVLSLSHYTSVSERNFLQYVIWSFPQYSLLIFILWEIHNYRQLILWLSLFSLKKKAFFLNLNK